jgi:hypothetical protein
VLRLDDPAWRAAAATGVAYLVALGGLFGLLLLIPYLLW